jgi:hypothetical protein
MRLAECNLGDDPAHIKLLISHLTARRKLVLWEPPRDGDRDTSERGPLLCRCPCPENFLTCRTASSQTALVVKSTRQARPAGLFFMGTNHKRGVLADPHDG